jgi:hypothetical protein
MAAHGGAEKFDSLKCLSVGGLVVAQRFGIKLF